MVAVVVVVVVVVVVAVGVSLVPASRNSSSSRSRRRRIRRRDRNRPWVELRAVVKVALEAKATTTAGPAVKAAAIVVRPRLQILMRLLRAITQHSPPPPPPLPLRARQPAKPREVPVSATAKHVLLLQR
jgi:hypothetical protein